jgi:glycosyltransferase involved in cell wall biosynthesis
MTASTSSASGLRARVWFLNRFFWPDCSATSQIVSDLAFHLAASGREVGVIASRGLYDDPNAALPARETRDGVTIHRIVRPRFGRAKLVGRAVDYLAMYRGFAAALWRLAAPGDVVVAKTDPPLLSCVAAPIARAKRLALVNWLQDLYPEVAIALGLTALKPAAALLRAARDASLRASVDNVAIGETMARRLIAAGVAPERVSVIPNWSDDAAVRPIARDANPLRAAWGLKDKFVLGYSGNLGRAHEYGTLLAAAALLKDEADLVFLFIGGGRLIEDLRREAERRGLADRFRFRPYQPAEALAQSLSLSDAHWISLRPELEGLIVPSKFYGVAAAGRPTIAVSAPDGEIGALVERYDCGVCVPPGDGAGLAAAIRGLMRDPERTAAMGANARATLESRFSRKRAFALWEAVLARASAGAAAPSAARRP